MIDFLPSPKVGELIKADHIASITKAIRKRTPRNSPTVKVVETADGFWLEAKTGGAASGRFVGCWHPTAVNEELINLTAGSITDGITTYLPDVTDITVHATNPQFIYLVCAITADTVDGYVTGGSITSATVQAFSSLQTNTDTTGYVLLCTWQEGAIGDRYTFWSLQAEIGNKGSGDVVFRVWDK
jgi:hypothetical protein